MKEPLLVAWLMFSVVLFVLGSSNTKYRWTPWLMLVSWLSGEVCFALLFWCICSQQRCFHYPSTNFNIWNRIILEALSVCLRVCCAWALWVWLEDTFRHLAKQFWQTFLVPLQPFSQLEKGREILKLLVKAASLHPWFKSNMHSVSQTLLYV